MESPGRIRVHVLHRSQRFDCYELAPGSDESIFPRSCIQAQANFRGRKSNISTRALPFPSRHETGTGYRGMIGWNRPDLTATDATLSCLQASAEVSDTSETDERCWQGWASQKASSYLHPRSALGR